MSGSVYELTPQPHFRHGRGIEGPLPWPITPLVIREGIPLFDDPQLLEPLYRPLLGGIVGKTTFGVAVFAAFPELIS